MAEPTLKKGSRKPEVKDLQEALKALGFSPGKIDGVFGAATEKAVKAFQASVGIDADGVVGPITWLNIDEADQSEPVLRKGSKGLPVRRLQSRMTAAEFDTGGVDLDRAERPGRLVHAHMHNAPRPPRDPWKRPPRRANRHPQDAVSRRRDDRASGPRRRRRVRSYAWGASRRATT